MTEHNRPELRWPRLPQSWRVVRADALFSYRKDIVTAEALDGEEVVHYSIPALSATGEAAVEDGSTIASSKFRIRGDEVLVSKLNPRKGHVFLPAVHDRLTVCSTEFVPLVPKAEVVRRFGYYLYLSTPVRERVSSAVQSATRSHQRANPDHIYKVWVPAPPPEDQRAIAEFLDKKTAAIDTLIAKKERLIDLIEETRQAAITRAVTKGLDPAVPMKASGVEWLGEVPAHWEVLPVRRVARFLGGTGFPHAYQGQAEGSYPFFKVEDMNSKGNEWILRKAANCVSEAVSRELRATICPTGSVVFAKVGAALLKNRRRVLGQASIIDNNMLAAVPTGVRTKYFAHALGLVDFGELRRPGPVPSITGGDVASIPIPIPPTSEQIAIAEHLDELRRRNRSMVRLISVQVERLREYRQTLISAAVTGQIDVRSRAGRVEDVLEEALA